MLVNECKWFQVCPLRVYWQEGKLDSKWIEQYCKGNWKECIRYQLEEKGLFHPDNMLPNGEIDANL